MVSLARFYRDRAGVALTEYMLMIGLVTVGLLVAVVMMFNGLAAGWAGFAGGALTVEEIEVSAGESTGSGGAAVTPPTSGAEDDDDDSDDDDDDSDDDDDDDDEDDKDKGKAKK